APVRIVLLYNPFIAVVSLLMWGGGAMEAVLCGKRFGRHLIRLPHADTHKTWKGSAAMAASSAVTGIVVLLLCSPLPLIQYILFSMIAAPFSAAAELYTHNGNDTVTVPIVVTIVLAVLCAV
ncbi:MAG: hypothetical protein LUF92_15110, partial [Clostridiales bacterium]|nr:hypothetical protein [Clostridiales bacterium]